MIKQLNTKLERMMHDGWAAALSGSGKRAEVYDGHNGMIQRQTIIPSSEIITTNAFENAFYSEALNESTPQSKRDLYTLKDVYVTGSQGHLFINGTHYLHVCHSFDGIEDKKIRRPIPWLAKTISDPVFVLMGRGLGNRGHFLVEHLPRYLACRDALPPECKIMVPPGQISWSREYLCKLGVDPELLIEASHGTMLLKHAFYMPFFSSDDKARLAPRPFYDKIRDAFLKNSNRPRVSLFVSRQDAPSRRTLNEDEIYSIAMERFPSLERISMTSLSLDEQLDLFSRADVVIGAHNQAFRNLLFCSKALCIQLVNGHRSPENLYYFWANNYSQLGSMFENDCVSLYSDTPLDEHSNWSYPADKFGKDLDRVIKFKT